MKYLQAVIASLRRFSQATQTFRGFAWDEITPVTNVKFDADGPFNEQTIFNEYAFSYLGDANAADLVKVHQGDAGVEVYEYTFSGGKGGLVLNVSDKRKAVDALVKAGIMSAEEARECGEERGEKTKGDAKLTLVIYDASAASVSPIAQKIADALKDNSVKASIKVGSDKEDAFISFSGVIGSNDKKWIEDKIDDMLADVPHTWR